jgi:hypothetical protein
MPRVAAMSATGGSGGTFSSGRAAPDAVHGFRGIWVEFKTPQI